MRGKLKDKIVCFILDYVLIPVCIGAWIYVFYRTHLDTFVAIFFSMILGVITAVFAGYLLATIFRIKERP